MIDPAQLDFVGAGLNRPECVLAHASGRLFVGDWSAGGGVTVIEADGQCRRILARDRAAPLRPNGIALLPGGAFLLAHLGADDGGVYRLDADGATAPFCVEVDGAPLPPTNFVGRDHQGRVWITVSTRKHPRALDYRADAADGFIVLVDDAGARIVADGLGYTNECVLDAAGARLFVNETFGRRIAAFDVAADGSLSARRTVTEFGAGTFPDGLALDADGGLWVTSVVSNRLIRVSPDGGQEIVIEDSDAAHVAWVEAAYAARAMGRPHLDTARGQYLLNLSSLAFGGTDLRTAYLGSLHGDRVARFPAPVAGQAPAHWNIDLGPLAAAPGVPL
jgi:sugar lactone lactonase YvrE